MLQPGETAPAFELPAAVDGDIERVALEELTEHGVVLLAFYPADFSPACTTELCALRDMDLFGLQPDVALAAVSTDTAYSHVAFAEKHGLGFPLLSDNDGAVAASFGVRASESRLTGHDGMADRSVFVLDSDLTVHYAWSTDDPYEQPPFETVREAIETVSDQDSAIERYRVAHEWYCEGRVEYERGLEAFGAEDWLTAADAFGNAVAPLTDAVDAFDAARRYASDQDLTETAATANGQATHRRNAAKWLARAADRYATGDEAMGDELVEDASGLRAALDDRPEPPAPDALPVEPDR